MARRGGKGARWNQRPNNLNSWYCEDKEISVSYILVSPDPTLEEICFKP